MDTLIVFGAKYLFVVVVLGALAIGLMLPNEQRKRYFITAAIAGALAFSLTKLAGALYFDPRPFTHEIHALIPHAADNGFPSDHAVLSTVAATLALMVNRKAGSGLLVLAIIVGICRVAAGIHSPIDVIAGILIGLSATGIGYGIKTRLFSKRCRS